MYDFLSVLSDVVFCILSFSSTFSDNCRSNSDITAVDNEEFVMYNGHNFVIFAAFICVAVPILVSFLASIVLYSSFAVEIN